MPGLPSPRAYFSILAPVHRSHRSHRSDRSRRPDRRKFGWRKSQHLTGAGVSVIPEAGRPDGHHQGTGGHGGPSPSPRAAPQPWADKEPGVVFGIDVRAVDSDCRFDSQENDSRPLIPTPTAKKTTPDLLSRPRTSRETSVFRRHLLRLNSNQGTLVYLSGRWANNPNVHSRPRISSRTSIPARSVVSPSKMRPSSGSQ